MRIAVGGFLHESHSFAPHGTSYAEFLHPGGNPPLVRGPALPDAIRGSAATAGGAITALEAAGHEVVPLLWCLATPAGPVEDAAFERIAAGLCDLAANAGPLDGVMLDLHGAAVAVSHPDAEGELLRRLRRILGPVPIAVTLDPHANLTAQMVAECDVVVPYRTYPHVDMRPTGQRAVALLLRRIARGAPFARAFRQLDYWMPITSQCTLVEPMASVMARRVAIEAQPGLVELAWCFGFPYADFADCGPAFAAYAETQAAADAAADEFAADLAGREAQFGPGVLPAAEAVAQAMRAATGPVVIADTQDNPGGGGHGDTTGLLAELLRQGADAVVCSINDADAAAACHAAGVGATLPLALGGRSAGEPLAVQATVLALRDGRFALTGPMSAGNTADIGPCALIAVAGSAVRVIVASRKIQAYDQAILRHLGVAPAAERILALKSSVHFRADFAPIASLVLVAAAPGPVVADPATLPFRHVRPGVRMRAAG